MLIVFATFPVAAPSEPVLYEELVCQVISRYLIWIGGGAVCIWNAAWKFDTWYAFFVCYVGILERIDVYCKSE